MKPETRNSEPESRNPEPPTWQCLAMRISSRTFRRRGLTRYKNTLRMGGLSTRSTSLVCVLYTRIRYHGGRGGCYNGYVLGMRTRARMRCAWGGSCTRSMFFVCPSALRPNALRPSYNILDPTPYTLHSTPYTLHSRTATLYPHCPPPNSNRQTETPTDKTKP
jgi:hypothetical protein